MLALLAVLTKPSSVLPALFGLALALLIVERPRSRRGALGTVSLALGVGVLLGLVYDWVMAIHLKMGLFAFLRAGTTGYYAQLANSLRADTILRLDFLGPNLRLPLAFVLVYGLACLAGLRHRRAAIVALAIGGGYALIGPFLAGDRTARSPRLTQGSRSSASRSCSASSRLRHLIFNPAGRGRFSCS